ncbi:hypothetical protein [Pseudonocardia spirodelae]|uniref:Uncharacterized protein n=1 Tax=Pseudonocardia spirodelae TaxID=3133431 RepID=A0ABU8T7Y6_9PSEU
MLYIGPDDVPGSDDHEGYVAGRTADGARTGIWTDPRHRAVLAYHAACECGWHDDVEHPPDAAGHAAALRAFVLHHFAPVTGRPGADPARHFLPPWSAAVPAPAPALT